MALQKAFGAEPVVLSPQTYNEMIQRCLNPSQINKIPDEKLKDSGYVLIRNNDTTTKYVMDILPYSGLVFKPEISSQTNFNPLYDFIDGNFIFESVEPTADTKLNFAVCAEDIPYGGIGWCKISGMAAVRLKVISGDAVGDGDLRASIRPSDYEALQLTGSTGAEVIYVNNFSPASGIYLGIIRLGRQ